MPVYSRESKENLSECHEDLQKIFNEVIKYFDCTVLCGHRGDADQNMAYMKGFSKLKYPQSKHNRVPSMAVDVVPYPLDWKDTNRMYHFGGYVKGIAQSMGINIRWGGDWDSDTEVDDQSFIDLPHFELIG